MPYRQVRQRQVTGNNCAPSNPTKPPNIIRLTLPDTHPLLPTIEGTSIHTLSLDPVYFPLRTTDATSVLTPNPFSLAVPSVDPPTETEADNHFIMTVTELLSKGPTPLKPPLFIFKNCPLAASHNAKVLSLYNYDIDAIIRGQHPSQLSYGSEFRSPRDLSHLLKNHPLWPKLQDILDNGATFPLLPMSEEDRKSDIKFHLARGNHKSSTKNHKIISDIISDEVERGFALPLPISIIDNLTGASMAPLGQLQSTIDEK